MKFLKWLDTYFEKAFLITCLSVMVLVIFMQIVLRWFGSATVWAEELARYVMLYLMWVAASYAVKKNEHIRLTVLVEKITGKSRDKLELVILGAWLAFAIWLMVEGVFLLQKIDQMVVRQGHVFYENLAHDPDPRPANRFVDGEVVKTLDNLTAERGVSFAAFSGERSDAALPERGMQGVC